MLLDLPADQIRQLIQECTTDPYTGGEAAVHITRWNGHGNAIPKDTPIAIKVYCHPDFKAQDPREWNEDDHRDQGGFESDLCCPGVTGSLCREDRDLQ